MDVMNVQSKLDEQLPRGKYSTDTSHTTAADQIAVQAAKVLLNGNTMQIIYVGSLHILPRAPWPLAQRNATQPNPTKDAVARLLHQPQCQCQCREVNAYRTASILHGAVSPYPPGRKGL